MQLETIDIKDFVPDNLLNGNNCFILETQFGYIAIFIHNNVAYKIPKIYINPRIGYVFDRMKVIAEKTFGIQLTHYQKVQTTMDSRIKKSMHTVNN